MTTSQATTLIVARHGNTFAAGDVVTRVGKTDLPLVESGRNQGRLLGGYLLQHNLVPDVLFTSYLQRTRQTADEAEVAMGTQLTRYALDMFNEIDYGPDENQPEEAVRKRLGEDALNAWDAYAIVPDGWCVEPDQIAQAWKRFADDVLKNYGGKTILVITSNGIARFAPHLTGDEEAFQKQHRLKIATGALCIFTHNVDDAHWACAAWNVRPGKV